MIGPDSFFKRIPEEWREEAFGFEYFVCVKGCSPTGHKEKDLFEGLGRESADSRKKG